MAQSAPLDLGIPGLEDAMLLGRGGFAVVYRAYQPAFRRTVAVKVVSVTHVDELTRERFRRECQAMGLLSEHPSIVTVLEAGFLDDGRPFLVMAYMPEGSLQDRLRQGPLGWQEATRIGVKLAGALGTAHQAGVLHRDVKPANVLVSQYGEPQLADFGIARVAGGQETSSGVITASLSYAPPEIVDGQRPSVASDVYALGATLHALMTGAAPFWKDREDSVAALINRVMSHPPPDLREHGVPGNIAEVLEQAMAKDPQDRPASAAQFGRLLRLAEDENGLRPTQMTVYKPADEPLPVVKHAEPPPTEVAPAVETSEDFADSPTDVVDTDEMLTATAAAASLAESPPADDSTDFTDSPTDVVDTDEMLTATAAAASLAESVPEADEATTTVDQGLAPAPVAEVAPNGESPVVPEAVEPDEQEPELSPTATLAGAAVPITRPEETADLAARPRIEQKPEPAQRAGPRRVWLAVAAAVAVLAVAGGYLMTRGDDQPEPETTIAAPTAADAAEFRPPPWWAEDPVLSDAVLVDADGHTTRSYAQVRPDGASVPGRWEIAIPPNWSPDFDGDQMTIAVGQDEVIAGDSIDHKGIYRLPPSEVSAFAAVFRVSVAEAVGAFSISLTNTSGPHRGFGVQQGGDGRMAAYTVHDEGPEIPVGLGTLALEPGVSYEIALIAERDRFLRFAIWPSENTSATWDEIAGATVQLGDEWTLPDGWSASVSVFSGGSVSIDEFWAFELPTVIEDLFAEDAESATFDFPEWWVADPDWSRADLVDHASHDRFNFVAGDPYGESVWWAHESPDWSPGFQDGMMTFAVGRGEIDYEGVPISGKRLWRSPPTETTGYAAVYRIVINELGDGVEIFMESHEEVRSVSLVVDGTGAVHGQTHMNDPGTYLDHELDRPITLEPGASYDVALISEGGGVMDLRLWPSGESPQSMDEVAGVRLDMGNEWFFVGGLNPGLNAFPGASVSIDEYWGFELPGGDSAAPATATIGMVFDSNGRGDQAFNDAAAAGLDRAIADLGIRVTEAVPNQDGTDREDLVFELAEDSDLVFGIGFTLSDAIRAAAEAYPDTRFAIVDDDSIDLRNVANLTFAEEEGSYLVGVAAGRKTETSRVGFIGGVDWELIHRFEAGFTAGVQAVNASILVDADYISDWPDISGFDDAESAQAIARSMYERGAGIVFHAAGGSGIGVFRAAKDYSETTGTKVWAIGVDSDQYLAVDEDLRPYILTSMMKRVDVAVYENIKDHVSDAWGGRTIRYDLAVDGVGYATSGGFVDDIIGELDRYKDWIGRGNIQVPDTR